MALPRNFVDLTTAHDSNPKDLVSVIGVVTFVLPPMLTKRNEWKMTIKLLDARFRDTYYGAEGMTVFFFKHEKPLLPQVRNKGDVILLRNIRVYMYDGLKTLTAASETSAVVFPGSAIPGLDFKIAGEAKPLQTLGVPRDQALVSMQEQAYVMALKHEMNVPVQLVDGMTSTVSTALRQSTSVSVLPTKRPPPDAEPMPPAKRAQMQEQAVTAQPRHQQAAMPMRQSSFGYKFKLVGEVKHADFADLCVQVVKIFPLSNGGLDVYVTDYTSNEAMFYYTPPEEDTDGARDGDTFGYAAGPTKRQFPGPYGWHVLKVNVKEPHASFISREVTEQNFVLLRNVKMKMRDGRCLEGDMWPDHSDPQKIQVRVLRHQNATEIQALQLRKEKYWTARDLRLKNKQIEKEVEGLTKAQKRARKKKKAAEKKASKAAEEVEVDSKAAVNRYVRCSDGEVPVSSLKTILDEDNVRHTNTAPNGTSYILPFINARYRARVRVVDFEPKQLEQFAILQEPDDDDRSVSSIDMDWETTPKYRWNFRVLLEDASGSASRVSREPSRLWAIVDHHSAQYLLGNDIDDPCDLTQDVKLLARLREKLCILWGNLEEKQPDEKLSNMPFECRLDEWGYEMAGDDPDKATALFGYARAYDLIGVTIS